MARIALLFTVLVTICVASCTVPTEITLYNNTATPIELTLDGRVQSLEGGAAIVLDDQLLLYRAMLVVNGVPLNYQPDWPVIPEDFVLWKGWGPWTKRTARLQLESDGSIWLIGVDQVLPVDTFVVQPEGYPLKPSAA